MPRWRFTLAAVFAAFVVWSSGFVPLAMAQDQGWFQEHLLSGPPRYEGLIDEPNAMREYVVLSFLASHSQKRAELLPDKNAELHVRFFLTSDLVCDSSSKKPVYLTVKPTIGRTNYVMKAGGGQARLTADDGWNDFHWPRNAVINKNGVNIANLGVVVRLSSDNEYSEHLVAAVFDNGVKPASPLSHYELKLRVQQRSLEWLSYQIVGGGAKSKCYWTAADHCVLSKPTDSVIEAGSIVPLALDLTGVPEELVKVRIEGGYKDSDDQLLTSYDFCHQPAGPQ
jgi:hypothetical protein